MGFVVTVSMLLILLMSVPNPLRAWLQKHQGELALWALLAGVWNFAWHGSQHLGEFWGNAAFISGLLMVLTSLLLLKVEKWPSALKTMVQTYQTAYELTNSNDAATRSQLYPMLNSKNERQSRDKV